MSLKKKIIYHTNNYWIVGKFFKMLPWIILASWKEGHLFAVIRTKDVCGFLPTVKPQGAPTMKIALFSGGGQEFVPLKTELHQKFLLDIIQRVS